MVEPKSPAQLFAPYVDMATLTALHQRNVEAFTELGTRIAAGAQSLLKRQAELAQRHISDQLAAATELFATPTPDAGLKKQLAFAQSRTRQLLAESEELAGILSATASDALDILCRQTQETVAELYSGKGGPSGVVHSLSEARRTG